MKRSAPASSPAFQSPEFFQSGQSGANRPRISNSGDRNARENAGALLFIYRQLPVYQHVGNSRGVNSRVFEAGLVDDAIGIEYNNVGELSSCDYPAGIPYVLLRQQGDNLNL